MSIDPAVLAQMDREKALWDGKLNELVGAFRDIKAEQRDTSIAFFQTMQELADVDAWKLMATLACAVQKLAEAE